MLISNFCSMRWISVFLITIDWMIVHCKVTPYIKVGSIHLIVHLSGEKQCESILPKNTTRTKNPDHSIHIPLIKENTTMQLTVALFNHYMKFQITLSSPYVYRYIVNKHGKVEHGHSCLLYFGVKLHHKTYNSTVSHKRSYGLWVQLGTHIAPK